MTKTETVAGVALAAAIGAAVGALTMFMLDPDSGRRRRALVRDKATHYGNEVASCVQGAVRDARNRAQGVAAEARHAVSNVMSWTGPERRMYPRGINQAPGTGAE